MTQAQPQARPFRWAILGTGGVARKFARDLRAVAGPEALHVVASRRAENARRFAADLGVGQAAPDYETALRADVEAVYIATPAALHEAHALMAIGAGKAVLIEKPLAPDAAAARRIAAAADAAGVFCMEAMWTRFQPLPGALKARIEAGALGEIRGLDGQFMVANRPEPGVSLFDPAQAGGALLHRGIYPLSLARFLLGPVAELRTLGRIGATGVDEDSLLILRHENGALSSLRASLRANGHPGTWIYGTAATLEIQGPVWRPTGARLHPAHPGSAGPGGPRRLEGLRESGAGLKLSGALARLRGLIRPPAAIRAPFAGNGYRHEAEAVMEAVRAGRTQDPRMTPQESAEVLDIIDAARAAWAPAQGATGKDEA
ncbi:Gfo/Idh/MocA family protein [Poseidonocella sedimentorum]|uniref:Predicted dehydrogenase n=1 Tax=Poseidonocella sedimentorum TaxID=871652 RepID=A0A1I6EPA8_9RHOB|nr:Gfo/Idh/MocA family oxidoreductase [Poseidonocella sedimentorum]SFR19348.1 Predicted dehydrogenase [Poseidonocella sedimentorum]